LQRLGVEVVAVDRYANAPAMRSHTPTAGCESTEGPASRICHRTWLSSLAMVVISRQLTPRRARSLEIVVIEPISGFTTLNL
jgi:hypothetical protein